MAPLARAGIPPPPPATGRHTCTVTCTAEHLRRPVRPAELAPKPLREPVKLQEPPSRQQPTSGQEPTTSRHEPPSRQQPSFSNHKTMNRHICEQQTAEGVLLVVDADLAACNTINLATAFYRLPKVVGAAAEVGAARRGRPLTWGRPLCACSACLGTAQVVMLLPGCGKLMVAAVWLSLKLVCSCWRMRRLPSSRRFAPILPPFAWWLRWRRMRPAWTAVRWQTFCESCPLQLGVAAHADRGRWCMVGGAWWVHGGCMVHGVGWGWHRRGTCST